MPGSPGLTSEFLHFNEMKDMGHTSTLLVLAELSWQCSLMQGCRELPKPRATAILPSAFSLSNYNPSKTSHPRSPLDSPNLPSGLKINKNLTSSNQSKKICQKHPFAGSILHQSFFTDLPHAGMHIFYSFSSCTACLYTNRCDCWKIIQL